MFQAQGGGGALEAVGQTHGPGHVPGRHPFGQSGHVLGVVPDEAPDQGQVFAGIAAQHGQAPLQVHAGQGGQAAEQVDLGGLAGGRAGRDAFRRRSGALRQPFLQGGIQGLGLHRLGDEVVHAGSGAGLAILFEGVGGHGQDRHVAAGGQGADGPGGLQAAHVGHLHVHEDQGVGLLARLFQGFHAILGDVHRQAHAVQQFQGHFPVDGVVLGQQQALAVVPSAQAEFGVLAGGGLRRRHDAVAAFQPGGEPEGAALAGLAVHAHLAAHQLGDAPGDHQAQAGAAVLAGGGGVHLLEGVEQVAELVRGDADAGVADLEAHQQARRGVLQAAGAQHDAALLGEFHRVAGVVEQGLAQTHGVAPEPGRDAVVEHLDAQALGLGRVGHQGADVVQHRGQGEIAQLQAQLAGLNLGDVQDVVDDGQQVVAGGVDLLQALQLLRGGVGVEQVGEAQDGVHGRADFVAHVGQELALGLAGRFGGGPGPDHGLFRLPALGDVPVRGPASQVMAVGAVDRLAHVFQPAHLAVGQDDAAVQGFGVRAIAMLVGQVRRHACPVFRVDQIEKALRPGHEGLGGQAGDALAGRRAIHPAPFRVDPGFPVVGEVGHGAVAGFRALQLRRALDHQFFQVIAVLGQALFGLDALGDVPGAGEHQLAAGLGVPLDPAVAAVPGQVAVDEADDLLLARQILHGLERGGAVFRMHEIQEHPAFQFGQGVAQGGLPGVVELEEAAFGVGNAEQVQGVVEIAVQFLGLLAQGGLGPLAQDVARLVGQQQGDVAEEDGQVVAQPLPGQMQVFQLDHAHFFVARQQREGPGPGAGQGAVAQQGIPGVQRGFDEAAGVEGLAGLGVDDLRHRAGAAQEVVVVELLAHPVPEVDVGAADSFDDVVEQGGDHALQAGQGVELLGQAQHQLQIGLFFGQTLDAPAQILQFGLGGRGRVVGRHGVSCRARSAMAWISTASR